MTIRPRDIIPGAAAGFLSSLVAFAALGGAQPSAAAARPASATAPAPAWHQRVNAIRSALARKSGAVAGPLVYICPDWTAPCQYGGVFGTYDQFSNPLFGVGPYGDIASDGLAYSVFPLGDVFHARASLGWTDPVTYATDLGFPAGCTAPHWYLGPNPSGSKFHLWDCVNGAWSIVATWP